MKDMGETSYVIDIPWKITRSARIVSKRIHKKGVI